MNSRKHANLAQQVIGFAGAIVAGAVVILPAAAQLTPNGTSGHSTHSTTQPTNTPSVPGTGSTTDSAGSELHRLPTSSEPGATAPETSTTPSTPGNSAAETPAGGTTTGNTTTTPGANSAETTPANPSTQAASGTIVDVAKASGSFKTLLKVLSQAELTQVLQGQGPYTVFAPTDAAFAALPKGAVDELLKPENRATLIQILKYHVVPGEVTSDQLTSGKVTTVEGSPITVTVGQGGAVKVDNADVIKADIRASNGVIHAIDHVILPPDLKR
jgi:uncharacterized surface protein with fasciclin (FAS1) repeats